MAQGFETFDGTASQALGFQPGEEVSAGISILLLSSSRRRHRRLQLAYDEHKTRETTQEHKRGYGEARKVRSGITNQNSGNQR